MAELDGAVHVFTDKSAPVLRWLFREVDNYMVEKKNNTRMERLGSKVYKIGRSSQHLLPEVEYGYDAVVEYPHAVSSFSNRNPAPDALVCDYSRRFRAPVLFCRYRPAREDQAGELVLAFGIRGRCVRLVELSPDAPARDMKERGFDDAAFESAFPGAGTVLSDPAASPETLLAGLSEALGVFVQGPDPDAFFAGQCDQVQSVDLGAHYRPKNG